jgi:hypothetical protein
MAWSALNRAGPSSPSSFDNSRDLPTRGPLFHVRFCQDSDPVDAKVKRYVETNWQRPSVRKWVEKERKEYVP